MSAPRPLLDAGGAAEYLGTTERHVRELVYKRQIPHLHVGRLLRFHPDDLDAYIDGRRVPVAS